MIDGRNVFDQLINSMNKTYENIRKIAIGKGDDYTTGCLLDYLDLSKQQALDVGPRKFNKSILQQV